MGWVEQEAQRLVVCLVRARAWKNQVGFRGLTSMKTLGDGGGIHEVASAKTANDMLIQVFDLHSDLLLRTHPLSPIIPSLTPAYPTLCAFPAWESCLSSDSSQAPHPPLSAKD